MKRIVLVFSTVILFFQLPCVLLAQQRPDFSGTWAMDPDRSMSFAYRGLVTLFIEQTPEVLTIKYEGEDKDFNRQYQLDGVENVHEAGIVSRLEFDQDRLTITTQYPISTEMGSWWATSTVTRGLAGGGEEMVTETAVKIDHGYTFSSGVMPGTSRDVFVRQE